MTLKEIVNVIKILNELQTLSWSNPENVLRLREIGKQVNDSSLLKNILNTTSAFSSGGFKSGVKAFGSAISGLVAAHPVLVTLGAVLASFAAANKWVYDADERFEHRNGAVALSPRKKTHSNKGLSLFCFHDIINLRKKTQKAK